MRKISMTALTVGAALASAMAASALGSATPASADDMVKCYGVSKAGENDCANQAAGHSCAGQSQVSFNGMDFKAVSKEKCQQLGGKLEPFDGINKNVKS